MNAYFYSFVFGIIGVRYRDLSEVFTALSRIFLLATPIIWMPDFGGRGEIIGAYLDYNPFYHFLEIFRAPLLGNQIEALSWYVVGAITAIGFIVSFLFYRKYKDTIAIWL